MVNGCIPLCQNVQLYNLTMLEILVCTFSAPKCMVYIVYQFLLQPYF